MLAIKYNLGSSADMERLKKDLHNKALEVAKEKIAASGVKTECPNCGQTILVTAGICICPFCQHEIDVKLNFNT